MTEGISESPGLGTLVSELRQRSQTISVAESCTGGLLAAALTERPGSSDYFLGGVVTYANAAKLNLLGVSASDIATHGAVSAEVARVMVVAVRGLFDSDVALSVTGVAGPSSEGSKPVGLTYIGAATREQVVVREYHWSGGRAANRLASVEAAIRLATELMSAQHDTHV